ncbi:MAG TPA: membrane dipeptidase, partial [Flavisolibacter sp.]|nr:membrane dipeptidase [Flavisolibacter sp.]
MVKQLCYLSVLLLISCSSYKRLHQRSYLVDTHNDILNACVNQGVSFDQDLRGRTHSDLNRFIEGGVDLQVFSVWSDGDKKNPYAYANQQIDTLLATISRNRNKISLVNNSTELQKERSNKKLSAMIGLEGGHMMENNLDHLDALYTRGVRYMTLTWNNSTSWATSAMDETTKKDLPFKGLTSFGKDVVKRMNQLGMIVDVSHVGERTFWDAIETTTKPVIASHSCVHSICPVFRNLKDDQIKAIAKNGGVIHLNFYSGFVDPAYSERIAAFNVAHKNEIDSLKKLNWPNYR